MTDMAICPIDMFLISQEFVSSFGLFLDIIGAFLLFKYGLPEYLEKLAQNGIGEMIIAPSEKDLTNNHSKIAKGGFVFLMIGFFFQLLSNWLPSFN